MAWTTPRTWVSGELVTASIMNTYIRDNQNLLKTAINDSGELEFTDATELTIASGVITVTQNYHKVDTEGDAASDDLDTITAGTDVAAGFILHLRVESDARTVVIKAGTGGADNLDIGADVTLDESYKTYSLVYDGTNWRPLSFQTESFASLSPLTTRGDLLYGSSGTVTGARLAVGAANTLLGSDGTDVAWQLKPLTTRGDILYGSSGVPTGTRLAVGGANTFLKSDGTDVSWASAGGDVELLHCNTGSSSTESAHNFDTYTFSAGALDAKDSIIVKWMLTITGATVIDPILWSETDSTQIGNLSENNIPVSSNGGLAAMSIVSAELTKVIASPSGSNALGSLYTVSTNWTAEWELAIRATNGSGGTTKWQWAVYALRGV
mgnify:CR=1 FL=1